MVFLFFFFAYLGLLQSIQQVSLILQIISQLSKLCLMNNFYLNHHYSDNIKNKIQARDDQVSKELIKICQFCAIAGLVFIYEQKLLDSYIELILEKPTSKNLTFYCYINMHLRSFWPSISSYKKIDITSCLNNEMLGQSEQLVRSIRFTSATDLDQIVISFFQILCIRDIYKQKPKLNQLTDKIIILDDEGDLYRQYCINFLKKEIQEFSQYRLNICCRFLYTINEVIQSTENDIQQFKKYYWPINNEKLVTHIKKTIVSFLNRRGGIIYIGLQQAKTKSVTINGIYLRPQQKLHFIQFIQSKILNEIYPKFSYAKSNQQISYRNHALRYLRNKNYFEYYLNKYISIDFLPIMDQKTLLNIENLYLTKIKVKPGDQKQFYHLLSAKIPITPEFWIREDKSVKNKTLIEGLNELILRLNSIEANKQFFRPYHTDCKFQLTPHEFKPDSLAQRNERIMRQKIRRSVLSVKKISKISTKSGQKNILEQNNWEKDI